TGTHGRQTHMGNVFAADRQHPERLDTKAGANLVRLADRLPTASYLTPHSDIVAQMVLAHQTQMHNLITLTNFQSRLALHADAGKDGAGGRSSGGLSVAARRQIERPAEDLVRYLRFAGEAPLDDPIAGTSGCSEEFAARGP